MITFVKIALIFNLFIDCISPVNAFRRSQPLNTLKFFAFRKNQIVPRAAGLFDIETIMGPVSLTMEGSRSGSIVNDMIIAACLSTVSDALAQFTSSKKETVTGTEQSAIQGSLITNMTYDVDRTAKFALFGFFDGAVGHSWFFTLESFIKDSRWIDIAARIAADTLIYTPLWCVWFLVAMTFLEKGGVKGFVKTIWQTLRTEWLNLLKLSTGFYLPIACVLYTSVPLHRRVLASAVGTMITTTVLSLWNANRIQRSDSN